MSVMSVILNLHPTRARFYGFVAKGGHCVYLRWEITDITDMTDVQVCCVVTDISRFGESLFQPGGWVDFSRVPIWRPLERSARMRVPPVEREF